MGSSLLARKAVGRDSLALGATDHELRVPANLLQSGGISCLCCPVPAKALAEGVPKAQGAMRQRIHNIPVYKRCFLNLAI